MIESNMKLSDRERLILAAYELRANAPVSVIKKDTGLPEHSIRYGLKQMLDRKIITPIPLISLHSLGLTVYNIFFSISAKQKSERVALLKALMQQKEVVWIGEMGGEFQYGMAVIGKHIGVIADILESLSSRFHRVFNEKAVSTQLATYIYYKKYLTQKALKITPLTTKGHPAAIALDTLDHSILTHLCTLPHFSRRQLATHLKLPHSTLESRVKRLEENEIIRGYMYATDVSKIGVQSFKLLVYAKGIEKNLSKQLRAYCEQHPDVVYLIECLGNWDYEIGFEVENTEEISEAIQELYDRFGGVINSIRLLTKFRDLKIRWYFG